jgi:hypothetical protein
LLAENKTASSMKVYLGHHWESLDVCGRTVKWMLEEPNRILWMGFMWLRIEASAGLL